MATDKLNQNIEVGDSMIFSAGKSVDIYEVLKIRDRMNYSEVFVNIGSSKKWKESIMGIKYTQIGN